MPGLDLGQVQDIVDQRQEVLAGGMDVADIFLLLFVEFAEIFFALARRKKPMNGVQRRTNVRGKYSSGTRFCDGWPGAIRRSFPPPSVQGPVV